MSRTKASDPSRSRGSSRIRYRATCSPSSQPPWPERLPAAQLVNGTSRHQRMRVRGEGGFLRVRRSRAGRSTRARGWARVRLLPGRVWIQLGALFTLLVAFDIAVFAMFADLDFWSG